jgi:chemotaxis signal transduction protein
MAISPQTLEALTAEFSGAEALGNTASIRSQYLLTQVESQKIAIASRWIEDVFILERDQILPMPFYGTHLLGLTHHQNQVVPLLATQFLVTESGQKSQSLMRDQMRVIRLNEVTGSLMGIGLVVDQILGYVSPEQLQEFRSTLLTLQLEAIPPQFWRPNRWGTV